MYFSAAQLATVGTSQISPETNALRVLSVLETLTGVALVTLILSFLFGVYRVVRDLRALSSNFSTHTRNGDDLVGSIAPYFFQGKPICLDNHVRAISESFWSYADGLRQHNLAYYFHSGREQFSLPYVLLMLGQWLAALRWGLPSMHPASVQSILMRLSSQFERFIDYLYGQLAWATSAVPTAVSIEYFSAAYRAGHDPSDPWLGRFLRLNRDMAQLALLDCDAGPQEAYARYEQWLPFAYRVNEMTTAVSQDLDYQQTIHRGDDDHTPILGPVTRFHQVTPPSRRWRTAKSDLRVMDARAVLEQPAGLTRMTEPR